MHPKLNKLSQSKKRWNDDTCLCHFFHVLPLRKCFSVTAALPLAVAAKGTGRNDRTESESESESVLVAVVGVQVYYCKEEHSACTVIG